MGYRFAWMLEKPVFLEREKTERQRMKFLVTEKVKIMVLFAGVGIIPLVLAMEKNVNVVTVEKNEKVFSFPTENIEVNRIRGSITPVLGDSYEYQGGKADRVVVPQPCDHNCFVRLQDFVKAGGYLHYCTWASTKSRLANIPGYEILNTRNAGSYAPGVWKVCLDMRKM